MMRRRVPQGVVWAAFAVLALPFAGHSIAGQAPAPPPTVSPAQDPQDQPTSLPPPAQQEQSSEPITADESSSIKSLEELIARIEASDQLAADAKSSLLETYRQALTEHKNRQEWLEKARQFAELRRTAPERLAAVKEDLTRPVGEYEVPRVVSLTELERIRTEIARKLDEAKKVLIDAEAAVRSERRAQLPRLIEERAGQLEEIEKSLSASAAETPGGPFDRRSAEDRLLEARAANLRAEIDALQQEQQSDEADREWLRLARDRAKNEVERFERALQRVTDAAARRRIAEAAEQVRRAEMEESVQTYPVLKGIAEANTQFAEERAGPSGVAARIEAVTQEARQVRRRLEQIQKQFDLVRQQIDVVGLTDSVASLLRRDRASLPDVRALRRQIQQQETLSSTARLRQFDLDDDRDELSDLNQQIELRLAELADQAPATPRDDLKEELRTLLEMQRDYLDALLADYDTYFVRLNELSIAQEELIERTREYEAFIKERILWAASTSRLGLSDLRYAREAIRSLLRGEVWISTSRVLLDQGVLRLALLAALILALVPLFWLRRILRQGIARLGEQAARRTADRIAPTLHALAMTLALSTIWAAWLGILASLVDLADPDGQPLAALADGIRAVALALFPLELVWQSCRRQGLAEAHVDWPRPTLDRVQQQIRRLCVLALPAMLLVGALDRHSPVTWSDSLGRLAFLVAMLALGVFLWRLLAPAGSVVQQLVNARTPGWAAKTRYVWYPVLALAPFALAILAASGYFYTANQLMWRIWATLYLIVLFGLAYGAARRWLLVNRRRIAIQQARQRRAQLMVARDESATSPAQVAQLPAELEIDLPAIDDQSTRLTRGVLAAFFAVGVWFVWVDVLPALGVLRRVPLGATQITLADMGLAMLVTAVAWVASRNMPGFIEMVALNRLPMDQGTRYAIATLMRYGITVFGLLLACGILGIGWLHVQWLVAAAAVGLGFGLQEIFANFISGLLIFAERPIRVGDVVTMGDVTGVVSRVQIRATTITNWDRKELIIPNKEFITGRVVNWTLSDRVNRIVISVGVAYGTDTELARRIMLDIARAHPLIVREPEPNVAFEGFGDSALTLVLRVYLPDLDKRLDTIHELHSAIDRAFRKANIEIAFPQRDIHIRTLPAGMAGHLARE